MARFILGLAVPNWNPAGPGPFQNETGQARRRLAGR
jgi:hypothetical protein